MGMLKSRGSLGLALMVLAMVTVGSTVPVSAIIGQGMHPVVASVLRFAIAGPILVFIAKQYGGVHPRLSNRDIMVLFIQIACGSVGYTLCLIYGMQLSRGVNAGLLLGTLPLFMGLFSVVLLREWPTIRFLICVGLAMFGVMLILAGSSNSNSTSNEANIYGTVLILAAVLCEASFLLLNKSLSVELSPLWQSAIMASGGFFLSVPLLGFVEPSHYFPAAEFQTALIGVIYYALVPTVLGFILWYTGSGLATGQSASLAAATMPLSAVGLSALFLGENLQSIHLLAAGLIILSIMMSDSNASQSS